VTGSADRVEKQIETMENQNSRNKRKKALTLDWMVMSIGSLQALSHAREWLWAGCAAWERVMTLSSDVQITMG